MADQTPLQEFLDRLGLTEEPFGMFYTNEKPEGGYHPNHQPLPSREQEAKGEVDWAGVQQNWDCVYGKIFAARAKNSFAWFGRDYFGCLGGAIYLGWLNPPLRATALYVTTGVPGVMEGESYLDSPEAFDKYIDKLELKPAPGEYCVYKPLSQFSQDAPPLLVTFFARPEILSGLHQLAAFVSGDPEIVASPWGAGCTGIAAWPLRYMEKGTPKAVISGWDPSCRKYIKGDELSFTLPYDLFRNMLDRWKESFLNKEIWDMMRKRIARSHKAWDKK